MTNTNISVGRWMGIAVATLVLTTLALSPVSVSAADLSEGGDYGWYPTESYDTWNPTYDTADYSWYPTEYHDTWEPTYDSYDSGFADCFSCGGGSFGGGGFFTSGGKVGGGDVRVSNVNNNYNQNQNQNVNNVHVNVNSDDDDEKEDKKKKKRRYDDRVVYHPPVYHNPPYVTLSQTPYTGLELGPVGTAIYWSFLVIWCLIAAYLIAVKKVHVGLANRMKTFLFGDEGEISHPAYESEMSTMAVASAAVAPQLSTLGENLAKSDIAEIAQALIDVIEGKSTRSYSEPVQTPAADTTDPFILSQIHRTR